MNAKTDIEKLANQTDRVHSVIEIKEFDDEKREFTGIATTPKTDRVGDVVEPDGAEFSLPIPLLWQHDRMSPVGTVTLAKSGDGGIEVKANIAKIDAPAGLKARVDEAWASLKHKLVKGLSIGFSPTEYSFMDNGGIHFTKWDWLELSLVTVPANAEATITSIKSFDKQALAALGKKSAPVVKMVSNLPRLGSKSKSRKEDEMKTISEQLKGFEDTRKAKVADMTAIMETAGEEGETLDAEQQEKYDTLDAEVKSIDGHIKRLRNMESLNAEKAEGIEDQSKMQTRERVPAQAKVREKLEPGQEFARYVMCLASAKGDLSSAAAIAEKRFPHSERINTVLKDAVAAGTTTDAAWAGNLVEYNQFAGDFVEYLRPMTILGKFGRDGLPSLRSIPFNVHIRGQDTGGTGYWVGQGAPKPLTSAGYTDTYLGFSKVAAISVLTDELVRFSNPNAEMLVRDELSNALVERLDTDFVDPTLAAVANVSPASVTNGISQSQASGTGTADDIRADVATLMSSFIAANISLGSGVWVMSTTTAMRLSLMRNALGQREFPDITMRGGTFEGLPVIASEYVSADSDGGFVYLMNASDIWLADDGNVVIDASREASLQMLDNPTNNSSSGTATSMVSMFQTNSIAIRAERWINWQRRRAAAVAVLANVHWGE